MTVDDISVASRAGEVKVPSQLYLPSWEVLSGSKVSVAMATTSVVFIVTVMPFPSETAVEVNESVQTAVGELIKPSTVLDTVQVRL